MDYIQKLRFSAGSSYGDFVFTQSFAFWGVPSD